MSDDYLRQQQQQHNLQAQQQQQQQHRQRQQQQQQLPPSPPPFSASPLLLSPSSRPATSAPPLAVAVAAAAAAAAVVSSFPARQHQQVQSEQQQRQQPQQQHFAGFPSLHHHSSLSGFVTGSNIPGQQQPREDVTGGRTLALHLSSSAAFPSLASVQASLSALPSQSWDSVSGLPAAAALSRLQQQQQGPGDMQQGSLLGTRLSIPAFGGSGARSALAGGGAGAGAGLGVSMGAIGTGMPGLMHQSPHHQSLHYDHLVEQHHPPVMDELLDQMFGVPTWSDMAGGGGGRGSGGGSSLPWEFNATGSGGSAAAAGSCGAGMDVASMGPLHGSHHKLFTMSLMPSGAGNLMGPSSTFGMHDGPDASARPAAPPPDMLQHYSAGPDDAMLLSRLTPHQHGMPDHSAPLATGPASRLQRSPSIGSSGSEGSAGHQPPRDPSPPPIAPTWRQPYVGGVPPLPMNLSQTNNKAETGTTEALLGKRAREDEEISRDTRQLRDGSQGPFASFGVTQLGQSPLVRQQAHQQQQVNPPGQGLAASVQAQVYGAQAASAHQATGPGAPAVARPRVRARRGQATDPHSIAERLRRERIAERMKALQELVPNSNKTDKASMLDEIIDYVKFLQLQVKVLSMSRLGGAGAVAPLVADLPAEGPSSFVAATIGRGGGASGPPTEGLALTERQVARLMEEDMGTAMQYLQSKGLCLMPISLATAISSNGPRAQTAAAQGAPGQALMAAPTDRQRPEQSAVVSAGLPMPGTGVADKGRSPRDGREAGDIIGSGEPSKSPKHTADSPRRQ